MLDSAIPPVSRGTGSTSRTFIYRGSDLLVRVEGIRISPATGVDLTRLGIPEEHRCPAGLFCCTPATAVMLGTSVDAPQGFAFRSIRSFYGVFDDKLTLEIGTIHQILHWDRVTRRCGSCGGATRHKQGERGKYCESCGTTVFPRISPAIITAVIKDRSILLAHNFNFKPGMYSLIAGYVEPGESLEECVRREVSEETGVIISDVTYFASQPWPFPDALMIGFTARHHSGEIHPDGVEIEHADWFTPDKLPAIPAPGSISRRIIDWFVAKYS